MTTFNSKRLTLVDISVHEMSVELSAELAIG